MKEAGEQHGREYTNSVAGKQIGDSKRPSSQIVEFYKGRCVLVTGASGFLGKLIIEKLLRTCSGIKRIFVLIRPKSNKTASDRLDELFDSLVFDKLKSDCSNNQVDGLSFEELKSKVVALQGSLEQPFLGLNIERLLQLADEVSIIIHSAALIAFAGLLRQSINVNLLGTRNLLQLACKLPKLIAFVYVSSSYSNSLQEQTNEHVYPVKTEPEYLLELASWSNEKSLEVHRDLLIGDHPNLYTYTKQMAEYLCAQFATGEHQLPVLICRPSIIVASSEEPIRGFVDNRNAGNGLLNCISQGMLRLIRARPDYVYDIIPADFVSNCVISLVWFADSYYRVHRRRNPSQAFPHSMTNMADVELERRMVKFYEDRRKKMAWQASGLGLSEELSLVPVCHVTSGLDNAITIGEAVRLIVEHSRESPSSILFREPKVCFVQNKRLFDVAMFLNRTLIGKLMDRFCAPPEPQLVAGGFKEVRRSSSWSLHFTRCENLVRVILYFLNKNFMFDSETRLKLIDLFMNDEDRRLFNCDVRHLDWNVHTRDMVLGTRRYLIGEADDTLPMARKKLKRTLRRNSLIKFVLVALACLVFLLVLMG